MTSNELQFPEMCVISDSSDWSQGIPNIPIIHASCGCWSDIWGSKWKTAGGLWHSVKEENLHPDSETDSNYMANIIWPNDAGKTGQCSEAHTHFMGTSYTHNDF